MPLQDLDFDKQPLCHKNNIQLKTSGAQIPMTQEHIDEIKRCASDIIYFTRNYVKVIAEDGPQLFELRDYQKEWIELCENNRFVIGKWSRQSGKCISKDSIVRVRIDGHEMKMKAGDLLSYAQSHKLA